MYQFHEAYVSVAVLHTRTGEGDWKGKTAWEPESRDYQLWPKLRRNKGVGRVERLRMRRTSEGMKSLCHLKITNISQH